MAGGILKEFWYPGISLYIKSARRLLEHTFSCLGRIQCMTQELGGFVSVM